MIQGIIIGAIIFGSIGLVIGGWLGQLKVKSLEIEIEKLLKEIK